MGDTLCTINEDDAQWDNAYFIIKRNKIRRHINYIKTLNFAKKNNKPVYVCFADDKTKKKQKPLNKSLKKHMLTKGEEETAKLSSVLFIVESMRVVVVENLYTELGVCNGTIGHMKKIIFDEHDVSSQPTTIYEDGIPFVMLSHIPTAVIIECETPNHKQL